MDDRLKQQTRIPAALPLPGRGIPNANADAECDGDGAKFSITFQHKSTEILLSNFRATSLNEKFFNFVAVENLRLSLFHEILNKVCHIPASSQHQRVLKIRFTFQQYLPNQNLCWFIITNTLNALFCIFNINVRKTNVGFSIIDPTFPRIINIQFARNCRAMFCKLGG